MDLFNSFFKSQASVTINGKTFNGSSISINKNNIVIDGNTIESTPNINITIIGNAESVSLQTGELTIKGNITTLKCQTGDINIEGNILGNVSLQTGDITCNEIHGNASTHCGDIISKNKF